MRWLPDHRVPAGQSPSTRLRSLRSPRASLAFLLAASSCRLVHANREFSVFSETVTRISGTVHATSEEQSAPILVVAFQETDKGSQVVNYEVLIQAGVYNLLLRAGKYRVFAFEDRNQDFIYQAEEPIGEMRSGIELVEGSNVVGLDIQLGTLESEHPPIDLAANSDNPALGSFRQTTGDIVSLDEPRFSKKSGVAGMWRPITAIERDQMGVFLLEAYDPCKTPVLFVHGIEGSPQDLRPIIEALDRTKFQPWILAYPSGLRLRFVASYLAEAVRELGVRHKPYRMFVVAHSMGGLIARSFINQNVALKRRKLVRLFVSISTPFNGHSGAAAGVRFSPVVAPVWIDMVPNSAFIKHLYDEPLADYVEHDLFFGYKGNNGQANDGVVFLSSVLDPRAQFAAKGVYGYDEDHTSILSSKDVIARTVALVEEKNTELGPLEGCQSQTAPE